MHARRLPRVIYGKRFPTMPFTFLTESQIHRDGTPNQPQHGESGGMWGDVGEGGATAANFKYTFSLLSYHQTLSFFCFFPSLACDAALNGRSPGTEHLIQ